MKRELSPGVIAVIGVVVAVVIGLIAYKTLGGDATKSNITPEQIRQMNTAKMRDMTARRDATGHPIDGTSAPGAVQRPGR